MSNIQLLLEQQRNKDFSNNSSPTHLNVIQQNTSPQFKVTFDKFPSPKAISEQSEVRDPLAPEQKLSLLSLPAQKNRVKSQSLQQKSDQFMSGRNSKQDLVTKNQTSQQLVSEQNQFQVQNIVKRFLGNLKMTSPLWLKELNELPLLEENYLRNEMKEETKKTKLPSLIQYIFICNHFISFILFPIQATLINIQTILLTLNIFILITEFATKIIIKKQFDFTSCVLNCISLFYIASFVMLRIENQEYLVSCILLYVNILFQSIYVFIKVIILL